MNRNHIQQKAKKKKNQKIIQNNYILFLKQTIPPLARLTPFPVVVKKISREWTIETPKNNNNKIKIIFLQQNKYQQKVDKNYLIFANIYIYMFCWLILKNNNKLKLFFFFFWEKKKFCRKKFVLKKINFLNLQHWSFSARCVV